MMTIVFSTDATNSEYFSTWSIVVLQAELKNLIYNQF